MTAMRIVRQNLLFSLLSVGLWGAIAWLLCLLYGWIAFSVRFPLPGGMGGYSGTTMEYAVLHMTGRLPAFLGGGALLGLIAAQVQFWAWFTAERDR